jgi:hypothetical protein
MCGLFTGLRGNTSVPGKRFSTHRQEIKFKVLTETEIVFFDLKPAKAKIDQFQNEISRVPEIRGWQLAGVFKCRADVFQYFKGL